MAYSRLPTCDTDYALGVQTVNTTKTNQEAHYDQLAAEHGMADELRFLANPRSNPARFLGHHATPRIPRDVLKVTCSAPNSFVPPVLGITDSWFVRQPTRLSAGQYFFPVRNLVFFWGCATPAASSTTPVRFARCTTYYQSQNPAAVVDSGIYVSCNEISAGSFVATDMDFSLIIYGYDR